MNKLFILVLVISCFWLSGCSIPSKANLQHIPTYTRQERKVEGSFVRGAKQVFFKDFRLNEAYEEDVAAVKDEVAQYINSHPDLSEENKNNLNNLRVALGLKKEEVVLLAGEPDKILFVYGKNNYAASELWVYKTRKLRAFTFFIIPVFIVHESYYLYFKDGTLVSIEKHYLEQIVKQQDGPGSIPKKSGSDDKAEDKETTDSKF